MVREKVTPPSRLASLAVPEMCDQTEDDNYVYDVYYMNDSKFDFKSLENILAVEACRLVQNSWRSPLVFFIILQYFLRA
jgi:hypothetical protein